MRISDWSSDVCSSDLIAAARHEVIGIVNADDLLKTGALGAVSKTLDEDPQVQIFAGMAVVERRHAGDRKVIRVAPSRGHRSQSWDLLFMGRCQQTTTSSGAACSKRTGPLIRDRKST